ncbi:MAG: HEAT repeat domain-containing protein [Elusimicrobia bacterium]|nr:HEAT repeat domain-containing protein [Elusimicrobiota bacterium]
MTQPLEAGAPVLVLLIEDNRADVRLIQYAMRASPIRKRLQVARDGDEALALLRRRPPFENARRPRLILLDLNLPAMDGRDLLAEIKQDPELKAIPVVVLTTSKSEEDIRRSYEAHANAYVPKPRTLEEFVKTIKLIERFWLATARLPLAWLLCGMLAGARTLHAGVGADDDYPPGDAASSVPAAFDAAGELRDSLAPLSTIPTFLRVFHGSDAARKRRAIQGLARSGNVAAIPYVGAVLLRLDEDQATRIAAAQALGTIGESRIGVYLSEALRDPDPEVRRAAVGALGQAAPLGAETLLEGRLRLDPSWWVRYEAALALGRMRQPFAVGALARAARDDAKAQVRLQAALALGELGGERAASALIAPLFDVDPGVRIGASVGLGEIGGPRVIGLLRGALDGEEDDRVRKMLIISLRRAGR